MERRARRRDAAARGPGALRRGRVARGARGARGGRDLARPARRGGGDRARLRRRGAAGAAPLFADLNSIGPEIARRIAKRLRARGIACVDGALHGQAPRLPTGGVLYLSGEHAPRIAALFGGALETRLLGPEIGSASLQKLLLSCVSKAMVALCLEVGAAAQDARAWPAFWEALAHFYPELTASVERMGPTLPRHAARRATELAEAEAWLRASGREPGFAATSRRFLERVAAARLPVAPGGPGGAWRVPELIEALRAHAARSAEEMA